MSILTRQYKDIDFVLNEDTIKSKMNNFLYFQFGKDLCIYIHMDLFLEKKSIYYSRIMHYWNTKGISEIYYFPNREESKYKNSYDDYIVNLKNLVFNGKIIILFEVNTDAQSAYSKAILSEIVNGKTETFSPPLGPYSTNPIFDFNNGIATLKSDLSETDVFKNINDLTLLPGDCYFPYNNQRFILRLNGYSKTANKKTNKIYQEFFDFHEKNKIKVSDVSFTETIDAKKVKQNYKRFEIIDNKDNSNVNLDNTLIIFNNRIVNREDDFLVKGVKVKVVSIKSDKHYINLGKKLLLENTQVFSKDNNNKILKANILKMFKWKNINLEYINPKVNNGKIVSTTIKYFHKDIHNRIKNNTITPNAYINKASIIDNDIDLIDTITFDKVINKDSHLFIINGKLVPKDYYEILENDSNEKKIIKFKKEKDFFINKFLNNITFDKKALALKIGMVGADGNPNSTFNSTYNTLDKQMVLLSFLIHKEFILLKKKYENREYFIINFSHTDVNKKSIIKENTHIIKTPNYINGIRTVKNSGHDIDLLFMNGFYQPYNPKSNGMLMLENISANINYIMDSDFRLISVHEEMDL